MKKYLYSALALPLLFACSSEDFDKEVINNDQFAGIEKVDATFFMDDQSATTRMDTKWEIEYDDLFGFAWLGGGEAAALAIDGRAWQNHNLIVAKDPERGKIFKPQTSIYVGNYFVYRPYDETTVNIGKIKFNSLLEQPLADGANETWNSVAKNAILIGDKWTDVKVDGTDVDGDGFMWNKAGINKPFKIYSAFFSNQTALDLTYEKNNEVFDGKAIKGATDIDYTYPEGSTIGAADIYKVEVTLAGAGNSLTYAPKVEPNAGAHNGNFWETQKDLVNTLPANNGFDDITAGKITLKNDAGIKTEGKTTGWFWFNSLPVIDGDGINTTNVTTTLETSYGIVEVVKALKDCAWVYEDPAGTPIGQKAEGANPAWKPEWIKLAAATNEAKSPKEWNPADKNTFINQYGNHKGKYKFTVDFSTGNMNNMHIKSDEHLQKCLKYYIASGKDAAATLLLDKETDGNFKISKISIALIQTIQAAGHNVKVKACDEVGHEPAKIIITQEGQDKIAALKDKTAVPNLANVFAAATDVYLSKDYTWTWSDKIKTGGVDGKLTIDAGVNSITNLGTLNVTTTNIELSVATTPAAPSAPEHYTLANAAGATINISEVTTVKNALTNLGVINVASDAELRAYDAVITNDATGLKDATETEPAQYGIINNSGVIGVTYETNGKVNNYGFIDMKSKGAITLLSSNQTAAANFSNAFVAANKLGVVLLPENTPTALVSVANAAETGFIKYNWTGGTTYETPAGIVKYNTLCVSTDIKFTDDEEEIQYIEFFGKRTQVINPVDKTNDVDYGYLDNLQGIYVHKDCSIIIEKTNGIRCAKSAHLDAGAAIYQGGVFDLKNPTIAGKTVTDYLGTWSTDQVVKY